jgi:hypothetical protein
MNAMNDRERDQIIATITDLFAVEINPCELCALPFRCAICGESDLSALILFTPNASFCFDCLGALLAKPGESSVYERN